MDGIHDVGGMHGFGPIVPTAPNEPPFHEPWEGRVFGMAVVVRFVRGLPPGRAAIEKLSPVRYLSSSYWQRWLAALEDRLLQYELVSTTELRDLSTAGRTAAPPRADDHELAAKVRAAFRTPRSANDPTGGVEARSSGGERVRVRRMHPVHHHRCPRFVRGVVGEIVGMNAPQPLPGNDTIGDPVVEPCYTVSFAAGSVGQGRRTRVRSSDGRPLAELLGGRRMKHLTPGPTGVSDPHPHDAPSPPSGTAARAAALEALLVDKGIITTEAVDAVVDLFERELGPHHGARIVARAWVDPAFKQRLLADAPSAAAELDVFQQNLVAVENTERVHNVVVCTLCSCYPWSVLGLPPSWYKSEAYRSRVVSEPRTVLREFGLEVPDSVQVRVWDSSAEVRYLVVPQRPDGTTGWSEDRLASVVTRNAMIGTATIPPQ